MHENINVSQLAERFGVTRSTINTWREQGRLPKPTMGPGQLVVWPVNAVEEFERQMEEVNRAAELCREMIADAEVDLAWRKYAEYGRAFFEDVRIPIMIRFAKVTAFDNFPWTKKLGRAEKCKIQLEAMEFSVLHDRLTGKVK
jgi:predicted DNA-binding transcriptional regulator AlpA